MTTTLKPCKFTFMDSPVFEGFAHGSTWNGFDNVAVTKDELTKIIAWTRSENDVLHHDDLAQMIADYEAIPAMQCGLYSLANGYATQIVDEEQMLCVEFQQWCDDQGLPQMSADELIHEDITLEQRRYLTDFIVRWDEMMKRQGF